MLTNTRITGQMLSNNALAGLQANLGRLQDLQEQLSSGRRINRPSDDPVGAAASMELRSAQTRTNQYVRNAENGRGWLGTADTALTSMLDATSRLRDLLLGSLSGAKDASVRSATAQEVDTLRDSMLGLANTAYLGRPIFAGNAATGQAYDATGTYLGDTGQVFRTVAKGTQVQVNVTGPEVFGTGASSLFTVASDIAAHLRADDTTALQADISRLDNAVGVVQDKLAEVGARYNRVDAMRGTAETHLTTLTDELSAAEDIDLPATIMNLQLQQTAYQAALGAAGKVLQPSLLDFLR